MRTASSVRAVLFDLDGTLLDHRSAAGTALRELLHELRIADTLFDSALDLWFRLERTYFDQYLAGRLSFEQQRVERLAHFRRGFGISVGKHDEPERLFEVYGAAYRDAWAPFSDVRPTIAELRSSGISIGVLSNGSTEQQAAKLRAMDVPGVGALTTSESCGHRKPAAAAFFAACLTLGHSPAETAFVGDDIDADAVGSRDAGLIPVWLDRAMPEPGVRGASLSPPTGVIRIESLRELSTVLSLSRPV